MATTNADIDKRLSALETDMALVKQAQEHQSAVTAANFKALDGTLSAIRADLRNFMSRVDDHSTNLTSSPVGREINKRLGDIENGVEERMIDHEDWQAIRRWGKWLVAGGGIMQFILAGRVLGWW